MILQRRTTQLLKSIRISQTSFAIVEKYKILIYNQDFQLIDEIMIEEIVDAISISEILLVILTKKGQIQLYQPKNQIKTIHKVTLKYPIKLIYLQEKLFILDLVNNLEVISNFSCPQIMNMKFDLQISNVFLIENELFISGFKKTKFQLICAPEKIHLQFDLNSSYKILEDPTKELIILYNSNQISIYIITFKTQLFEFNIDFQIVDVHKYQGQYLIVTQSEDSCRLYQLTYKDSKSANFVFISQLENVNKITYTTIVLDNQLLISTSTGHYLLDQNFKIKHYSQTFSMMTKLRIINNGLFAQCDSKSYSELYRINSIGPLKFQYQHPIQLQKQEKSIKIIPDICQQRNILLTNQRILILDKNYQIMKEINQIFNSVCYFNQHLVLIDRINIYLFNLQDYQFTQIIENAKPLLLQKAKPSFIAVYTIMSQIIVYELSDLQQLQQLYSFQIQDLTSFLVIDKNIIYGTFENQLKIASLSIELEQPKIDLEQPAQIIKQEESNIILVVCSFGYIYKFQYPEMQQIQKIGVFEPHLNLSYIYHSNRKTLLLYKQEDSVRCYTYQNEHIIELQNNLTQNWLPFIHNQNIMAVLPDGIYQTQQQVKSLEFDNQNYLQGLQEIVIYANQNIIITRKEILILEKQQHFNITKSFELEQEITSGYHDGQFILIAQQNILTLFKLKAEQYLNKIKRIELEAPIQLCKLFSNYIFIVQNAKISIYKFDKDNPVFQHQTFQQSIYQIREFNILLLQENNLLLFVSYNKMMLSEYHIKISSWKIQQEFHSSLNVTPASSGNSLGYVFSPFQNYIHFEKCKWAEGGYFNKDTEGNVEDIIMDSVEYFGKYYFLGLCGALYIQ